MKLSASLLTFVAMALLTGCDTSYTDGAAKRQAVIDAFKTTDIQAVPGYFNEWIVRTPNGEVWYAQTYSDKPEITGKTILFSSSKDDLPSR